jgi:hypothetical protein
MVNKNREKMAKKAALRKKGKNLSVMGITVVTISFKQENNYKMLLESYFHRKGRGGFFTKKRHKEVNKRLKTREKESKQS